MILGSFRYVKPNKRSKSKAGIYFPMESKISTVNHSIVLEVTFESLFKSSTRGTEIKFKLQSRIKDLKVLTEDWWDICQLCCLIPPHFQLFS